MITISIEEYQKLFNAVIELNKSNEDIRKLETIIEGKDAKINQLMAQIETTAKVISEGLSQVSYPHCVSRR